MATLLKSLRKIPLYPGDKAGTQASDVLAALAVAQRFPGMRAFFLMTFKIIKKVPLKKLSVSLSSSKELLDIVTKFTSAEAKMYSSTLEKIGFPPLEYGSGRKVTGFAGDVVRTKGKQRKVVSTAKEQKIKKVLEDHIDYLSEESFFQKAHKEANRKSLLTRNKVTREFYHKYAAEHGVNYRSRQMIKSGGRKANNLIVGRMYFFRYQPAVAEEEYDNWPLVFSLYEDADNISGVNLHHMDYKNRIIQLGRMLDFMNNQKFDKTSRLYAAKFRKTLWNHRLFRHSKASYRQYRIDQMQSKIIEVHPMDWDLAITVPTERFLGVRGNIIDSKRMWKKTVKRAKEL
ncbi:MAG: hypothetical protein VYA22_02260 [Pseudomonadota bacterium]|nr:hypothetical protein [Pseudomonadota bacterium]